MNGQVTRLRILKGTWTDVAGYGDGFDTGFVPMDTDGSGSNVNR